MKRYTFFPSLLVRTPLYSLEQYGQMDYAAVLKSELFQAALYLSSASFFTELQKKQFDYNTLSDKQKGTVKKYLNRASFRSTPFGLFSSFSVVNWDRAPDDSIVLSPATASLKLDFKVLYRLWEHVLKNQLPPSVLLQTNQSLYVSGIDFRYLKKEMDAAGEARFSMISLAKNTVLKKVLTFCRKGRKPDAVLKFLESQIGAPRQEAVTFLTDMISQQILVPDHEPRVTGTDYAAFLSTCLQDHQAKELGLQLGSVSQDPSLSIQHLSRLADALGSYFPEPVERNYYYAISRRTALRGGVPQKFQQSLQEGLYGLELLSDVAEVSPLNKFKSAFIARYDRAEVPLLEAMDAQLGIGYGEFEHILHHRGLPSMRTKSSSSGNASLSPAQEEIAAMLLQEWQLNRGSDWNYEVEIQDEHLKTLEALRSPRKLPPSLSVLFRTLGEQVVVESASGPSALSLLGRFSFDSEVAELAGQIAQKEQQLNKEVVFAEIAHICNLHIANIDRRPHVRDYEIPVLLSSSMDESRQIPLSDLLVSVLDDTVVLRSQKLKKRIIPRLSSAFNFTKSSFPVFRFLCDVQNQQVKSAFVFSLAHLVPGLRFYPRVRYKSCILQLAEWHLEAKEIHRLREKPLAEALTLFAEVAREINLPRYFAYTFFDHFLVFDRHNADDIALFLKEVPSEGRILLREYPFVDERGVTDRHHRTLAAQYIACLYLNEEVYAPVRLHGSTRRPPALLQHTKDWLYFKIYCHPLSADAILCTHLFPLLKKYIKSGAVQEWFWVRYQDPEYHLRLRIKPCAGKRAALFEGFTDCLGRLFSNRLVRSYHTDSYQRELQRYSGELILLVESFFTSSSHVVARFLKKKTANAYAEEKVMIEAALSTLGLLEAFGFSAEETVRFCKFQFEQFFSEFGSPKEQKPELEKLFKQLQDTLITGGGRRNPSMRNTILHLVDRLKNKKACSVTRGQLAADLIHMHLNRLFVYHQRYFEMTTYFLLYRSLSAREHRKTALR